MKVGLALNVFSKVTDAGLKYMVEQEQQPPLTEQQHGSWSRWTIGNGTEQAQDGGVPKFLQFLQVPPGQDPTVPWAEDWMTG